MNGVKMNIEELLKIKDPEIYFMVIKEAIDCYRFKKQKSRGTSSANFYYNKKSIRVFLLLSNRVEADWH